MPEPHAGAIALIAKWSTEIMIGLAATLALVLKWIGLRYVNDVDTLKRAVPELATKQELRECKKQVHDDIGKAVTDMHKDVRSIHDRLDRVIEKSRN